jgi:hypothetical protein
VAGQHGDATRKHAGVTRWSGNARKRPLQLEVSRLGAGRYRARGQVVQSEYGIKPYTALFGALKLADPVGVEAEVDVSGDGA